MRAENHEPPLRESSPCLIFRVVSFSVLLAPPVAVWEFSSDERTASTDLVQWATVMFANGVRKVFFHAGVCQGFHDDAPKLDVPQGFQSLDLLGNPLEGRKVTPGESPIYFVGK